ncbi:MAG: arginase [Bacteroidetes bacterium]|nr:arginase [Bacteroidota bacterium]
MNLGADKYGAELGPAALRNAGIKRNLKQCGYNIVDNGDITVHGKIEDENTNPKMKHYENIVFSSTKLAKSVEDSLLKKHFPLVLGGDHSMALGTIAGVSSFCKNNGKHLGVIWIDAHADMNTDETTLSGNIHGMPLAASLGFGNNILTGIYGFSNKIKSENCSLIGIRDVDDGEQALINKINFPTYTMEQVKREGITEITKKMLNQLTENVDFLHVSFDIDSIDPKLAPGVGTTVPNGFDEEEINTLMIMIAETGLVKSLEITEVNPILDIKNISSEFAVKASTFLMR